ncbi:MAG TPA: tetratricopeptide repeat protein, partial [Methylomirabilota bacterium]|nr:tetratricopeptide repeat protein [Methylomirabilota bacterium]
LPPARAEFRWVLERDPQHPRALLGVARVALEEGDAGACRESLQQALHAWPDFPEAQALLDGLAARPVPAPAPASTVRLLLRVDRLQPPETARGLALARADGAVLTTLPGPGHAWATVERPARVLGLAGATLARAGLGPLRRVVMEDENEAVFVRTDGEHLLALAMPPGTDIAQGILQLHRLWATAGHELELATAAARGRAAGRRRAS